MDFRRKMREHLFFSEQCSLFKTSLTVTNFECFYFYMLAGNKRIRIASDYGTRGRHPVSLMITRFRCKSFSNLSTEEEKRKRTLNSCINNSIEKPWTDWSAFSRFNFFSKFSFIRIDLHTYLSELRAHIKTIFRSNVSRSYKLEITSCVNV